jgi:hypothetical protein
MLFDHELCITSGEWERGAHVYFLLLRVDDV